MIRRYLILLPLLAFTIVLQAQKIVKVHGHYIYQLPENVSLEQGKRIALERAKIQALADAFGTIISQSNSTVVENSNGKSSVEFLSLGGSDVKGEWIETVGVPTFQILSDNGILAINVEVLGKAREIKRAEINYDARLLRNGTEKKFESDEFRSGDDLFLYFQSPVNGYLAVYLFDHVAQQVFCLLPYRSSAAPTYKIEHDRPYMFFSAQHTENNEQEVDEYTMTCSHSTEQNTLYIIFSPNLFAKPNTETVSTTLPRQLDYPEFQKWLAKCRTKDSDMQVETKVITIKK